ncbi:cutinase family protein [Mycobacterium sp. CBMA293]|uniref:cutinase family protein n=1 Tax=unclassified Mycolicibacterium TaxID=2636767 RepID=UPI0012DBD8EB|nr:MULTISPECIES: cutinase family protein [unclassified Mycolicibacterium]MUL49582.1 cutinase family protein [Mycolicibacterium sp. CBMA 360]MUL61678.1 cutinase family protein [Mycolicibacterium sp. CBMA 335]MUL74414.1 cutinase family protein [Mycolicibacterium sp. CBMA 311]MUL96691.1 cutinase family protein [Mycolicibacterium sp. CBMA 230]MUM04148.1 cutinase family protein [Mycolicibacterium sp. CBMA 213]
MNASSFRTLAGKVALAATAAFTIIVGASVDPGAIASAADDSCANVEVVFARGTFEAPGVGATGQAFVDALNARMPGKNIDAYGVNYPASLDFGQAADGVADATNRIEAIAASCPATKIVIGGYSQGAAVAGYSTMSSVPAGFALPAGITGPMPSSVASHVAAVVLFGTPSPFVLSVADRGAPAINIGGAYAGKTLQLCAPGDPICGGGMARSAHSAYKFNGMANQAADFVARQLGAPAAPAAALVQASDDTAN